MLLALRQTLMRTIRWHRQMLAPLNTPSFSGHVEASNELGDTRPRAETNVQVLHRALPGPDPFTQSTINGLKIDGSFASESSGLPR